ncbi:endonuclease/exonuclease/phosphatase family protein [Thermoactinospora rubra]|uniref:endonuclease/exonuclease/phosphatase family protein n=1 Tax=Thermoactinospora rubra TaxID=1088767 RepID=UPI000A105A7A|nr:endonuclease/exonuclease/phosphatase family protein [Thermoactinospora rubra]
MPAAPLVLGIVVFLDVLRVFLPSLITLFGRAGETPAELMGAYAALWFALPFLAVLLKPRWALYGGAAALAASRVILQTGAWQLAAASAGVSAGIVFLYGCARTLDRKAVPVGLAGGLAASIVVHLLLDNVDLVWHDGVLPWLGVVALCGGFALSLWQASPSADLAPGVAWFLFGPALLLTGMAAGLAQVETVPPAEVPWLAHLGTAALVFSAALLVAGSTRGPRPEHSRLGAVLASGLLLLGTVLVFLLPVAPVGVVLLFGATGLLLSRTARLGGTAVRPGGGLLGGMLVFLLAVFLYYAAYDMDLGFPNTVIPLAVAVAMCGLAVRLAPRGLEDPRTPSPWKPLVAAALLAPAAVAATWWPLPDEQPKDGDTFTLIAYNIRMGFGLDGRLSLDAIADWAASKKPDVVLLSEVDRGWLLNGGHDDLERIARRLGMRYHFAPAADRLWGDAVLTNLPAGAHSHPLGRHDYPTGAQAQAIVLGLGEREVGVVNTHLQAPHGQAAEVADMVRALAAGQDVQRAAPGTTAPATGQARPVILAGDLNIRPEDPEMRILLEAGLRDHLTAPTSPAGNPTQRIDHVLVTEGLTVVSASAERVPYSDHLPVVATLRLTSLDQGG